MIRITTLIALCVIPLTSEAQICRTRGVCLPQQQVVVQEVIQVPQIVAAVPQVYVLNNVPAVPQGNVAYSSVYPDLNLINVDQLAAQALQLQKSAIEAQSTYQRETLEFVERLVEIQRPVAEALAKGQAAAEVLREAGLDSPPQGDESIDTSAQPSLAQQFCGKCHVGPEAKAGFKLDEPFDAAKAIGRLAAKTMPPKGQPQPDEAERLLLIAEMVQPQKE